MPVNAWLSGRLIGWARRALSPEALARSGAFRPEPVAALLDGLERGEARLGPRVLSLLAWQVWHDLYLADGGRPARAAACPGHRGPRSVA